MRAGGAVTACCRCRWFTLDTCSSLWHNPNLVSKPIHVKTRRVSVVDTGGVGGLIADLLLWRLSLSLCSGEAATCRVSSHDGTRQLSTGARMSHRSSPARAYDFLLKFLLVGDSDVGKGEILASLQDGASESPYGYNMGEWVSECVGEERRFSKQKPTRVVISGAFTHGFPGFTHGLRKADSCKWAWSKPRDRSESCLRSFI